MFKYETHLHSAPVSRCGKASIEDSLAFYAKMGYAGVFVTNHFLDGNVNIDWDSPMTYEEKMNFYCSDYEKALELAPKYGLQVFFGVELSYGGTDFLIYNLEPEWFRAHPEIMEMEKSRELPFMMENGALVIQAHPYREAGYIDHIRLYPRCVHGTEVINANRTDLENKMALLYAQNYGHMMIAGTDNHMGSLQKKLAGVAFEEKLTSTADFKEKVLAGKARLFHSVLNENGEWESQL